MPAAAERLARNAGAPRVAERLACRETLAAVSTSRLTDLGVLREMGSVGLPIYDIAALGMELYLACQNDAPD